jgi:hypothetical protein
MASLCAVTGITNRSLRALMTGLPGARYGMSQASYDLDPRTGHRSRRTRTRSVTGRPSNGESASVRTK